MTAEIGNRAEGQRGRGAGEQRRKIYFDYYLRSWHISLFVAISLFVVSAWALPARHFSAYYKLFSVTLA